MNNSFVFTIISIIILVAILTLFFLFKKQEKKIKLTKLTSLSLFFIIAGIIFNEGRLIGYSLLGVGVVLAMIDIVRKRK